jgi:hypothetical protein
MADVILRITNEMAEPMTIPRPMAVMLALDTAHFHPRAWSASSSGFFEIHVPSTSETARNAKAIPPFISIGINHTGFAFPAKKAPTAVLNEQDMLMPILKNICFSHAE